MWSLVKVSEGNYFWLHTSDLKSNEWYKVRKGRVSPSRFHACLYDNPYFDTTVEQTALVIAGKLKIPIPEDRQEAINAGINLEPKVRTWYEQKFNKKVKLLNETEYGVYYKDTRFGGLCDGFVGEDGMIEIKCRGKLSEFLLNSKEDCSNIPKYDMYQMHGYMAIYCRKWCDYLVYCKSEKKIFFQRVFFNEKLWESIYKGLVKFHEDILDKYLDGDFPIHPNK